MRIRSGAQALCFVAAVSLLPGCTGVVPVKSVQTDKPGYLAKTFSLQSVPTGVAAAIKAKDAGPLAFHKITLSVTPVFEGAAAGSTPQHYHVTLTLINAGGPFVQALEEMTSNGIATREDYAISYRNFLAVRAQTLLLSRTDSNFVMEIKSLDNFTPLAATAAAKGDVDMRYGWGNQIQMANIPNLAMHCQYGEHYPAAKLNPKFAGDAQDLKCESLNSNGVVVSHTVRAFLAQYGITVMTRNQTASAIVIFQIEDAAVE
jgi:hypothetical protein